MTARTCDAVNAWDDKRGHTIDEQLCPTEAEREVDGAWYCEHHAEQVERALAVAHHAGWCNCFDEQGSATIGLAVVALFAGCVLYPALRLFEKLSEVL